MEEFANTVDAPTEGQEVHDSSDSDVDSLQIAIETTPKRRKRQSSNVARLPKAQASANSSSQLDKTIEETIQKCENITPDAAKKMLLKLIRNEHVLALSMLKAEEEEKRERRRKTSDSDDDDKKSEAEAPATPKLTRLKAKQLNHQLPLHGSLKKSEPSEEVVALIRDELKSDDEDDEYHPGDNDSDDDVNNQTLSDIESQPSTPGSALFQSEQDIESPMKDGDFKMPRMPSLSAEEQENISRRTRSKVCLTTTPIETLENTFIPPDCDYGLYDYPEQEMGSDWIEFLQDFMMPLTTNEDDDEKTDPEYVAAESVPVDKEELKFSRVSKKEYNQLIAELLEDSCNFTFDSEPGPSTSTKRNSSDSQNNRSKKQRIASPPRQKPQLPKISSRMYSHQELLSTPPSMKTPETQTPADCTTPGQISFSPFFQPQLQTPQRTGFTTPTAMHSPMMFSSSSSVYNPQVPPSLPTLEVSSFPRITGVYGGSAQNTTSQLPQPPSILVLNSQNQLEIQSPMNLINQAFCNGDGVVQLPQFQNVVVQVPTIDILSNRINLSSAVGQPQEPAELDNQNEPEARKKMKFPHRKDKLKVFDYLNSEEPPEELKHTEAAVGFTAEQMIIYGQQMRMHAQLLSQHYLQLYANPKWWDKAESIKTNLIELKQVVNHEASPLISAHIDECLSLCNEWEKNLDVNSERNKKYAEFLHEEYDFDVAAAESKQPFRGRFHNRLMEHVLSSKAIIYPKLLPKIPFRMTTFNKIEPVMSELKLLAFGYERFRHELYEELNRLNPYKIREPKPGTIIRSIIREYSSFRKEKALLALFHSYRNHQMMNPIKFYYLHKKAPAFTHEIEDVDLDKIIAPRNLRRGLLPKTWDAYMFSHERLQIYPYEPYEEQPEGAVDHTDEEPEEEETKEFIEIDDESSAPSTFPADQEVLVDIYTIQITGGETPNISISITPQALERSSEVRVSCVGLSSPGLSSPTRVREKSTEEKQKNLISILKKVTDNLTSPVKQKKSVNFLLPSKQLNRTSPRFAESQLNNREIANDFLLTQKFFIIIESFFNDYIENLNFRNGGHPLLIRTFHWSKSIDIYLQLVKTSVKMIGKKRQSEASTSGSSEPAAKTKKNVSSSEEYSKKLHRKLSENRELIMHSDRNKCTIEKDCSYAYNYLDRVKKTLMENGDDELYSTLMSMLTSFNPDFESVPELFHKIESILLPNYSELVDLFLTFLLPEHAAEIGKFFEHFVLNNMANLIRKLTFFFQKQPKHMRQVYAVLNDLSNDKDITMEKLKEKVLPLLKGNQLLIDWFMELFGKPNESFSEEYETVYIKKSLSDSESSIDNYEEIHSKDLLEVPNIDDLNSCGVRYRNGKIMYQGTLLPAKISFLAHDAPPLVKGEENALCSHEIRKHVKFNELKKPEVAKETPESSSSSPPKKAAKKYKLCDTQTLHAHAVRLNPFHARNEEKLSDLASLLIPHHNTSGSNDERNSPKKTRSAKRTGNSPKKSLNKSPSSSSGNSVNISPPLHSPSKALLTARKLKNLVDDGTDEAPKKKVKPPMPKPAKVEKKKATKKQETEVTRKQDDERGAGSWTREEDKIILEEYRIHYDKKEEMLQVLLTKLTNRRKSEINTRYEFLLDIVKMHKDKE